MYYKLERATRAATYTASIKPFQQSKNGRDAWLTLSNQYAGNDKWEAEIKGHEQLLHTPWWKGQTNFTLERFIAQHRNAFVSMQAAAKHVMYQLPNEHISRVGYLLDAIQCNDAGLQAAMASIKTDQAANGMHNSFEASATYLLPYVTRSRRNVSIKQEANVTLQTFLMQPVKKQMSRPSAPRRAPDPAEFLSGTTLRLGTICSTSSRRASSKTGGQESEAKMRTPLTRMFNPRKPSTKTRRRTLLLSKGRWLRR